MSKSNAQHQETGMSMCASSGNGHATARRVVESDFPARPIPFSHILPVLPVR